MVLAACRAIDSGIANLVVDLFDIKTACRLREAVAMHSTRARDVPSRLAVCAD